MTSQTAPAWLLVEHADGTREFVRLDLSLTTLGRGEQNVVELLDPKLSRFHCEIERRGARWLLRDCQSRNGTQLNGAALGPEPRPLAEGDRIALGHTRLTFHLERPAALCAQESSVTLPASGQGQLEEVPTPPLARQRPTVGFDPRRTQAIVAPLPRAPGEGPWRLVARRGAEILAARTRAEVLELALGAARELLQAGGGLIALAEGGDAPPTPSAVAGLEGARLEECLDAAQRALDKGDLLEVDTRHLALPLQPPGAQRGALVLHDLPRPVSAAQEDLEALRTLGGFLEAALSGRLLLEEVRRAERAAGARRLAQDLLGLVRPSEQPRVPGLELGVALCPGFGASRGVWDVWGDGAALLLVSGSAPDPARPDPPGLRREGERDLAALLRQAELRGRWRAAAGLRPQALLEALDEPGLLLARFEPEGGCELAGRGAALAVRGGRAQPVGAGPLGDEPLLFLPPGAPDASTVAAAWSPPPGASAQALAEDLLQAILLLEPELSAPGAAVLAVRRAG